MEGQVYCTFAWGFRWVKSISRFLCYSVNINVYILSVQFLPLIIISIFTNFIQNFKNICQSFEILFLNSWIHKVFKMLYKGNFNEFSHKEGIARFTTVPFNLWLINEDRNLCVLSLKYRLLECALAYTVNSSQLTLYIFLNLEYSLSNLKVNIYFLRPLESNY